MYLNEYTLGFAKADQRVSASGSPMADLFDVWHAGAPRIDMYSPDNARDFAVYCARFTQSGNPLFIPEGPGGMVGAARALYAIGHHDAIGYSRMGGGIERVMPPDRDLLETYDLIAQLAPLISEHQGDGTMSAVLLGPDDPPQKVRVGNYMFEAAFTRPRSMNGAPPVAPPSTSAAIFIATGPDEYFAAGSGLTVKFSPNTPGPPLAGLATVEEGRFVNGRWVGRRRLAGDDTLCHESGGLDGDCLELRWPPWSTVPSPQSRPSMGEGIQHFTLYRYQ
jgi:hypothetical protein